MSELLPGELGIFTPRRAWDLYSQESLGSLGTGVLKGVRAGSRYKKQAGSSISPIDTF